VQYENAPPFSAEKVYYCPGYRLPTEAEWEYAYRAGSNTPFYPSVGNDGTITVCSGGSDPNADKIGWYFANSGNTPHPKGQKAANAWGLYDMAGNVREWCHDLYQFDLGASAVTDPWGSASGSSRVLRGGSWGEDPDHVRAANHPGVGPLNANVHNGLRCARTLNP
jgi:formylglycine-generating enzyme required for sulfatase activity